MFENNLYIVDINYLSDTYFLPIWFIFFFLNKGFRIAKVLIFVKFKLIGFWEHFFLFIIIFSYALSVEHFLSINIFHFVLQCLTLNT